MNEIQKLNKLFNINPSVKNFVRNLDITQTAGGEMLDIDRLFNHQYKNKTMSTKYGKKPAQKPTTHKEPEEAVFAQGITIFKPREGAPDYVKGSIIVSIEQFVDWCEKNAQYITTHATYGDQIKFEVKESQGGMLYLQVNTYKSNK